MHASIAKKKPTTRLRKPLQLTPKKPYLWLIDAVEVLEERQRDADGIGNHFVGQ